MVSSFKGFTYDLCSRGDPKKMAVKYYILFSGNKENTKAGADSQTQYTKLDITKVIVFCCSFMNNSLWFIIKKKDCLLSVTFFHWWLTCPPLQLLSRFFTEPCEDEPSYEFSCPRWQAQGYCEKRQKEMQVVCRKTCGFCGEWAGVLRKKALVFGLCSTRRLRDGRLVNYGSASLFWCVVSLNIFTSYVVFRRARFIIQIL